MGKTGNFRHPGSRFFVGNRVLGKDTPPLLFRRGSGNGQLKISEGDWTSGQKLGYNYRPWGDPEVGSPLMTRLYLGG